MDSNQTVVNWGNHTQPDNSAVGFRDADIEITADVPQFLQYPVGYISAIEDTRHPENPRPGAHAQIEDWGMTAPGFSKVS